MIIPRLKILSLTIFIFIAYSGLFAQSEPESSVSHVIILQADTTSNETVLLNTGEEISFRTRTGTETYKGTIEEITDTTVVIGGAEYEPKEFTRIVKKDIQKWKLGLTFLGILALVLLLATTFLLAGLYFFLSGSAIYFLFFIFAWIFYALAYISFVPSLILGISYMSRAKKKYDLVRKWKMKLGVLIRF